MMIAMLLAAAEPVTAIDAERAFASDAQKMGQWTAFDKWAAPGALMFLPKPTDARAFFGARKNPDKAVEWWPSQSFQSCDGRAAINHGGAVWPQGFATNFTTVWFKGRQGWRWTYDAGQTVKTPLPRDAAPAVRRASCKAAPRKLKGEWARTDALRAAADTPLDSMQALSADRSLAWAYRFDPLSNYLMFRGWLWNGSDYGLVIDQAIPPE